MDGLHHSPEGNAAGRASTSARRRRNGQACELTGDKAYCTTYHAADEAYADKIWYWTTPISQCLDGRGNTCTDYAEWTQAWTEIKG